MPVLVGIFPMAVMVVMVVTIVGPMLSKEIVKNTHFIWSFAY